jgi:UDP-glucose 4-epimerase
VAYDLPITIWGNGEITRDFFYIEDLVCAMVAAATRPLDTQRTFNVGGREAVSLNQLLHEIEVIVGKKASVIYSDARIFDAPHIKLDTHITEQYLQWASRYSLSEGLSKTWDWMKETIPRPNIISADH